MNMMPGRQASAKVRILYHTLTYGASIVGNMRQDQILCDAMVYNDVYEAE